ncbi:hypothetical protein Patl1_08132 [Pistacia atlantica]|uniref:Uncharacterized protein n=1 Tax=Pistacia atlantica TaxID=434234 RepID=A0ACC1AHM8_9ROSI|nr:hypothetical protein Patl1_08132 [Pistacia atlantica]
MRSSKDDSYLIPLNSWTREFSEVHDKALEGSVSDSEGTANLNAIFGQGLTLASICRKSEFLIISFLTSSFAMSLLPVFKMEAVEF